MGRIRRLFKGTIPLFSALWLGMMLVLLWLNSEGQSARMGASMQSYRWSVEYQYSEIWNGSAAEKKKPVILTWRLMEEPLYSIGGITQTRVYDRRGRELARRPMAMGTASPIGTGVYTWSLLLDPVLSEEEQLSLAERLRAEPGLGNFFGTAGGFYEELETGGLYCEVVGVVDEKREVIYPQRLTYCYADREITLVDTDSGFFDGRELVTLRFDGVQLNSALVGVSASPRELLQTFRAAETSLDALLGGDTPTTSRVSISSDGSECAPMSDGEIIVATAYTCNPLRVALRGQGPTAVLTLLAAVGMAVFTDRRQRETLERERAFTRAAAHELKTPLAVLRTHAEALREDIAPARRGEYLDVVLDESDRMAALVGSLLELSRMEEGGALHREVLAMDALVRAVFDRLALPLERKGLHLKLNLEPGQVFGDRARLESAVENLASNALRYTPEGGAVSVRLERAGGWLRLAVDNDGPSLTTQELTHLFEPFYRGDAARSRATGGTGLGLAIVRTAAAAHGGTCWAENRAGGVRIWMELPALQSA